MSSSISTASPLDVINKQKDSVVRIYIHDKNAREISKGSGFVINSEGIIATNYEVIKPYLENDSDVIIKSENGANYSFEDVIIIDETTDTALLKVSEEKLPSAKLAFYYYKQKREDVYITGDKGSELISGNTTMTGNNKHARHMNGFVHIDIAISNDRNGTPVFNSKGEIIGTIKSGKSINTFIPIRYFIDLLNNYKEQKKKLLPLPNTSVAPPLPPIFPEFAAIDELEHAEKRVDENNNDSEAYFYLGIAYHRLGKLPEAEGAYKKAIDIRPDYKEALNNLADIYAARGRLRSAIETYKQSLKIEPDYFSFIRLGILYDKLDIYPEAIETFKKPLNMWPDRPEAYIFLGIAYHKAGMVREAIESYKQALNIAHDNAYAYYNIGIAYGKAGMYSDAVEAYKQALRIYPFDETAHYNLGIIYLALNDRKSALNEYRMLKNLDSKYAEKLFDLIYK